MNHNEVDAWWGSYSMRSVLPGLLIAMVFSGLVWATVWLAELSGMALYAVTTMLTLAWSCLALRWGYAIFGCNYRLTTHRLFREQGLLRRKIQQMNLEQIADVTVKQGPLEKYLNVGRIAVAARGSAIETITLEGVLAPEHVAEKILALSRVTRS
jgi:membrane protein YdbS with pleckstrin-like domain